MLAASRRRRTVGRDTELAALRRFLGSDRLVLAYLHGPGGVGKTTILDAVTALATDRPVAWVDCADHEPGAAGFVRAVHAATGLPPGGPPVGPGGLVVVDRLEAGESIAGWLWREFLPSLPQGVQVVVAGRRLPPESWRADPAFAEHALVLPVRNLAPGPAAELARLRGLTGDAVVERLVRATRGHPLAIVIATDDPGTPDGPARADGVLLDHPDAAARLLGRFLDDGVTPPQRAALHVCGHVRRVDRAMLRDVLQIPETDADDVLAWLRERPYAESHPDGLALHDVVGDALDRDLRWRDRAEFARLHTRVRDVLVERMAHAEGAEHDRWARDLLFLHRGNPEARNLFAFDDAPVALARPVRADDPEDLAWAAAAFRGERREDSAAFWLRHRAASGVVFEDALGGRTGACLLVRLDAAEPEALRHDGVAGWALRALARIRPPDAGEGVLHQVVAITAGPERAGVVTDQVAALSMRAWRERRLGWVVLSTAEPAAWEPTWAYLGFERLGACTVDGTDRSEDGIAVWARDFARSPFTEWLAAMAVHELDEHGTAPPPVASPVALSRADFAEALRRLLTDLHDPSRIRANPLVGSRLAHTADDPGADPAVTLAARVRGGVRELRDMPRMGLAAGALDRTFVRPAGSREKAAEVLGTSFSTYRRHLATGIERLEALLWDRELHGPTRE